MTRNLSIVIFFFISLTSTVAQNYDNTIQGTTQESINANKSIIEFPEVLTLDSIYYAPTSISWFGQPLKMWLSNNNNLIVDVAEITDLYSGEKKYRLHYDINFSAIDINLKNNTMSISQFITYEKGLSIVNALKALHNYITEHLPSVRENLNYTIELSSDIKFNIHLTYNPKNYKWKCCLEFSSMNSKTTYSKKFRIDTNGFTLYGYLNNSFTDIPQLISILERQLLALKTKQSNNNTTKLITSTQKDGSVICFYNNTVFPTGNIHTNIEEIYDFKSFATNLNKKIAKVIKNEALNSDNLDKRYGFINIVIGSKGKVLGYRLTLSKGTYNKLNKRTISLMLNCIENASNLDIINHDFAKLHDNILAVIPLNL